MTAYTCYLISNKPEKFEIINKSISPVELQYFDGANYPSFSKLVNDCVKSCPTEIVIIMSDKVLPTVEHVEKVIELIDQGYGFVALYRFAFFGFKKELFRQVGAMDERFIGGGYEDDDFYIRLHEANISMYVTEEIPYARSRSSWNYDASRIHFTNKWVDTSHPEYTPTEVLSSKFIKRKLAEENNNYNLGPATNCKFLPFDQTLMTPTKVKKYIKD